MVMMNANLPASNFLPERLKEAREARGINTMIALAGLVGKNASTVSRWEDGKTIPTFGNLNELARALNVRDEYFFRPHPARQSAPVFFRTLANTKVKDRERQRARLGWLQDISQAVQHYVEFPAVDIPNVLGGESYRTLRSDDIERIASDLRKHWSLGTGPLGDALQLMERIGVVVAVDEVGTIKLDGLCQWSAFDARPYVLLASDKMNYVRRQMDAMHELSHAILHRGVDVDMLKADFDLIETQAFRLASALLMPADSYPMELRQPSLNAFLGLKRRWRVSIKAQIKRCVDLNIIDAESATQIYKYYSAKGWNREEPLDKDFVLQKPRLLSQSIMAVVSAGYRSKSDLLSYEFVVPAADIEQLASLPDGWFSVENRIVKFRDRESTDLTSCNIIEFPVKGN